MNMNTNLYEDVMETLTQIKNLDAHIRTTGDGPIKPVKSVVITISPDGRFVSLTNHTDDNSRLPSVAALTCVKLMRKFIIKKKEDLKKQE